MDRLEIIKRIREVNSSYSFEDIEKILEILIAALKEGFEKDGKVDLGEWGVILFEKEKYKKTKTGWRFTDTEKGGSRDSGIHASIPLSRQEGPDSNDNF